MADEELEVNAKYDAETNQVEITLDYGAAKLVLTAPADEESDFLINTIVAAAPAGVNAALRALEEAVA